MNKKLSGWKQLILKKEPAAIDDNSTEDIVEVTNDTWETKIVEYVKDVNKEVHFLDKNGRVDIKFQIYFAFENTAFILNILKDKPKCIYATGITQIGQMVLALFLIVHTTWIELNNWSSIIELCIHGFISNLWVIWLLVWRDWLTRKLGNQSFESSSRPSVLSVLTARFQNQN